LITAFNKIYSELFLKLKMKRSTRLACLRSLPPVFSVILS